MNNDNHFTVYLRGNDPQEYISEKKYDLEKKSYTVNYSESHYNTDLIKQSDSLLYVLSDMSFGIRDMMEVMYVLPQSIILEDSPSYKKTIFVIRPDEESQKVFVNKNIAEKKKPVLRFAEEDGNAVNEALLQKTDDVAESIMSLRNYIKTLVEKKDSPLKDAVAKIANQYGHIVSETQEDLDIFEQMKNSKPFEESDFYRHLDADIEIDKVSIPEDDVFQNASRLLIRASFYLGSQNVKGFKSVVNQLNQIIESIRGLDGVYKKEISESYDFLDVLLKDSKYETIEVTTQDTTPQEIVTNNEYTELISKKKSYNNLMKQLSNTNLNTAKYNELKLKRDTLDEKKKKLEELEEKKSSYNSKKAQYKQNIEKYNKNITNLNSQILRMKESMNEKKQKKEETNELRSKINQKKLELEENKSKLESTKQKLDELKQSVEETQSEYSRLEKEVLDKNTQLKENESKINANVVNNIQDTETSLKNLEEKRNKLKENKNKHESEISNNSINSNYNSLKSNIGAIESEVSESDSDFKILENKKQKRNEIQKKINNLQWNQNEYNRKVKNYQTYKKMYRFSDVSEEDSQLSSI